MAVSKLLALFVLVIPAVTTGQYFTLLMCEVDRR